LKKSISTLLILIAFLLGVLIGNFSTLRSLFASLSPSAPSAQRRVAVLPTNTKRPQAIVTPSLMAQAVAQGPTATETFPPFTPLPSLTPSKTLRPPPTFEPPTLTFTPTDLPTVTPAPTLDLSISVPGLKGLETPTPAGTGGCEPRKEWKLVYRVQPNDALSRIADQYNTNVDDLVAANCLKDKNMIVVGQELRVPGKAHPQQPEVACRPFELLTPIDNTLAVEGGGNLSFVWVGPRATYNLIRIIRPDNSRYERVVEFRQNEEISLPDFLPAAGTYSWYVYPLDKNFVQACPEGGPWRFTKALSPTLTPTIDPNAGIGR
jgi:LysM repeat protein